MLSTQSGPRDWSPSSADPSTRPGGGWTEQDLASGAVPEAYLPPATVGNGAGWLSLTLGTVAMILCLLQPGNTGSSKGYLVSTVGISAVAWGIHSLSLGRRGLSTARVASWVGIVFGVIGTAVMVLSMIGFYLTPYGPTDTGALPLTSTATPSPAVYSSLEEERLSLAHQLGTLAVAIQDWTPDGLAPETVTVDPATGVVSTPDGQAVARLELDAVFTYEVSADRTRIWMTLTGSQFGFTMQCDSTVGDVAPLLEA